MYTSDQTRSFASAFKFCTYPVLKGALHLVEVTLCLYVSRIHAVGFLQNNVTTTVNVYPKCSVLASTDKVMHYLNLVLHFSLFCFQMSKLNMQYLDRGSSSNAITIRWYNHNKVGLLSLCVILLLLLLWKKQQTTVTLHILYIVAQSGYRFYREQCNDYLCY